MTILRDRLIHGTAMNLIAVGFNQGSTLFVNIIVARILMMESFGEYAMIQSTLLMLASLSQFATGYTASKYIAEFRNNDPEKAGRILGLCAVVSAIMAGFGTLVLVVFAPLLAATMLKAPHLSIPLILGSGFLFFSTINGYQTGALSGLEAYSSLAKAGVASGIMAVIAISLGAWLGGLAGTLTGLSVSAFVRCAIHNRRLRLESRAQGISPQYRSGLKKEKQLVLRFALPAAISGSYSMPMIWLANSFLVRQPGGYQEMALYAAASNLRMLVLFLPNVLNSVSLSILNNEKAKGDTSHYHRLFRSNVVQVFLVALSLALLIAIFGKSILQMFGKDFRTGSSILYLLLASTVFESLSFALFQYVQSQAKIWYSVFSIVIPRETLLVVTAYFLVQPYGGYGLATAFLSSTILGLIAHFILVSILYRQERKQLDTYPVRQPSFD